MAVETIAALSTTYLVVLTLVLCVTQRNNDMTWYRFIFSRRACERGNTYYPYITSTRGFQSFFWSLGENGIPTRQMKYSEEELATAATKVRDDALYFRGLDWENKTGKNGRNVTPWREHYSNCWAELYKVGGQATDQGYGLGVTFRASFVLIGFAMRTVMGLYVTLYRQDLFKSVFERGTESLARQ